MSGNSGGKNWDFKSEWDHLVKDIQSLKQYVGTSMKELDDDKLPRKADVETLN